MKLISLNIWGGGVHKPLIKFIKDNAGDTDIFCFQEVFSSPETEIVESQGIRVNILADLEAALSGFRPLLAPVGSGYDAVGPVDFDITESQAIFVKEKADLKFVADGGVFVCGKCRRLGKNETIEDIPRNFQYARLLSEDKEIVIVNVHGLAFPSDKLDNPGRIAQSQKILDFLRGENGRKILCGDFNLLPETKSIAMIEEAGMINLIKKFNIERTRSRLSQWSNHPKFQKFADYVFISPDVSVISFSVPDVAVSDHLPLVLEFS